MEVEPSRPNKPEFNHMSNSTSTGGMGFKCARFADRLSDGFSLILKTSPLASSVFMGMYLPHSHQPLPALPYPTLIPHTIVHRKAMNGPVLFGLALISGIKAVFAMVVFSHPSHWWFLSYVEGYVHLFPLPSPNSPSILNLPLYSTERTNECLPNQIT